MAYKEKRGSDPVKKDHISNPAIGRLPKYYRCVEELFLANCIRVSSATLSQRLGFTASQIRQDFSSFGEFGLQGYGYNVKKLRYEIRELLGLNSRNTAILVGCGNMGRALLGNLDFEQWGFFMLAAFDTDPAVTGTSIGSVPVMEARKLRPFVEAERPSVAVLTVPRSSAPEVAGLLAELGIQAIWSFTGCDLHVEEQGVLVERVNITDSLLTLSYRLHEKRAQTRQEPERNQFPPEE